MPGACRALSSGRDQPPDTTSLEALDSAVAMLVDELAREAATSTIAARPESAHEAWLHALGTADGLVRWDRDELQRLAAAVREWRRPVAAATDAPFRLCFRLEEPAPQEDGQRRPWSVRYLLQSRRDPSLLIPAEKAWQGRTAERLLGALTREQRDKSTFTVDDDEWRKWMNQDFYVRQGVSFLDMTESQRQVAIGHVEERSILLIELC